MPAMLDRRTALGSLTMVGLAAPLPLRSASNDSASLKMLTQSLLDGVAAGRAEPWKRLLHPNFVMADESGNISSKADVVAGLQPLGQRISAKLTLADFQPFITGDVAVATYITDEVESFFDHTLRCQYRTTDTWQRADSGWLLLASQVHALRTDPPTILLSDDLLRAIPGTYSLAADKSFEIKLTNQSLWLNAGKGAPREFCAETNDVFFVKGQPRYRYILDRKTDGVVSSLIQRREAWDLRWVRQA